jgi:hypothetical protein
MKTKNLIRLCFILIAALSIALTGCKKDEITEPDINNGSTSVQQISEDDNFQQKVIDDINMDVEGLMSIGSQRSITWLPCNATIDSTSVINDTITYYITYHGLNCPETLYRTGKVEVKRHVDILWYMPGATVLVQIINFHVTHVATGRSITINGVKTHTNVTGGYLIQLGYGIDVIIHKTHGFMTITFDDNTNRTWNIARRCVYTGTLGEFVLAVDGFGQVGTYTNLVTWGVARNGDQFYISIPQSVEYKEVCSWDPVSGISNIDIPSGNKGATLTFGYDSNNQPITPGDCPTKYKVDWYHNGNSGTIFLWL